MKEWNDELLEEITIDVNKLIDDVQEINGNTLDGAVYQDSYGDGVCIVGNSRYTSWKALAIAHNLNILKYMQKEKG
jgi:hypothetical protein